MVNTEYIVLQSANGHASSSSGNSNGSGNGMGTTRFDDESGGSQPANSSGRIKRGFNWAKGQVAEKGTPTIPKGVPSILANRRIVIYAWGGSMLLVGWDDWNQGYHPPRPHRLWGASWVFGLLALASYADALTPLANALAIGYFLYLLWKVAGEQKGVFAPAKKAG